MILNRALLALLLLAPCCGASSSGSGMVGDGCAATADCRSGLTCQTNDPGGQCIKVCATNADCGTGAVCNGEKKCYKACATNADCTRGAPYVCTTDSTSQKFCDTVSPSDGGSPGGG